MPLLLDTNVPIHLHDGDEEIIARLATGADTMALSMATMIEQAGLAVAGELAERRRVGLGRLLKHCEVFDLDASVAAAYGDILANAGFPGPASPIVSSRHRHAATALNSVRIDV